MGRLDDKYAEISQMNSRWDSYECSQRNHSRNMLIVDKVLRSRKKAATEGSDDK